MAYAEKRGKGPKPWRVKYRRPDGAEGSESGFETKKQALTWGREQESKVSSGQWTDPGAGKIPVDTWLERWLEAQDVGLSTVDTRDYLIRRFIAPQWGSRELGSIGSEEINSWEKAIPPNTASPAGPPPTPGACCAQSWVMRLRLSLRYCDTTRRCGSVTVAAGPAASSRSARSVPGTRRCRPCS